LWVAATALDIYAFHRGLSGEARGDELAVIGLRPITPLL
jgi:hypothetical protein